MTTTPPNQSEENGRLRKLLNMSIDEIDLSCRSATVLDQRAVLGTARPSVYLGPSGSQDTGLI
jgi:hypothetical protein